MTSLIGLAAIGFPLRLASAGLYSFYSSREGGLIHEIPRLTSLRPALHKTRLDAKVKSPYAGHAVPEVTPLETTVIWDDEPGQNVEHVAENGLTPDEVDEVLLDDSIPTAHSNSTGRPCKFGHTSSGKYIIVIWDELCDDPRMIYPVTAYEVPEPS